MFFLNGIACSVCQGEKFWLVWRNVPELRFGIADYFSIKPRGYLRGTTGEGESRPQCGPRT
jgi:hypothetical protein